MADMSVSSEYPQQKAASTQPPPVSEEVARERRLARQADSEPRPVAEANSGEPPRPVVNSQGQTIGTIVNTTA